MVSHRIMPSWFLHLRRPIFLFTPIEIVYYVFRTHDAVWFCFWLVEESECFVDALSITNVGSGSFRILAAPFLAVFGVMVPFSRLMFFNRSLCSSTGLNPVSLSMLNIVVYFRVKVGIIVFTCSVVGTLGSLSSLVKNVFAILNRKI